MDSKQAKIQKLKDYFKNRDDVAMAFLFGSQSNGTATATSDWDVGVYFFDDHDKRSAVRNDIETIVGSEVDIVVLNSASARIAWPIISTGDALVIKDHDVYMRAVERTSREADSWYQTADEYYRIFLRSASLSARDRARLQEIVEFIDGATEEYTRFRLLTQQIYMNDKDIKRSIEHWIEHLINAAVDIAKTIRASDRRPLPGTYREFLISLAGIPPFDKDNSTASLADWVYLRNALSHEYLDYRWKEITSFVNSTELFYRKLSEHTKQYLQEHTEGDSEM
jgi:uncharacterized protein